jgi:hypothetical protein
LRCREHGMGRDDMEAKHSSSAKDTSRYAQKEEEEKFSYRSPKGSRPNHGS